MKNKCPICNTEYQQADMQFCTECCWELVLIPVNASDNLKKWFYEKKEIFEKDFCDFYDDEKTITEKSTAKAELEKHTKELHAEIEKISNERDKLQEELDDTNTSFAIDKNRLAYLENLENSIPTINNEIEILKCNLPQEVDCKDIIALNNINNVFKIYYK